MTALLVGLDVLLVCLLAWLWIDPHGGLRGVHWQPPAAIRPELGAVSPAMAAREDTDVARFMVILDRPIFSTTRRPPPAKAAVAARADPLDAIHIYGLFSGSGGGGAIIKIEGKTRRVKVSEAVGDWALKEIRGSEAVFSRGSERRVIPLVQAKQGAGTAMLPPAFGAPMVPPGARAGVPGLPFPAAPTIVPTPPAGSPALPPTQPPAAAPGAQGGKPAATLKPKSPFVVGGSS